MVVEPQEIRLGPEGPRVVRVVQVVGLVLQVELELPWMEPGEICQLPA